MIKLVPITAESKPLLWQLLQEHLAYIGSFYGDVPDENGVYPYRYFDAYFQDCDRFPYLFEADGQPVGFALVNSHSETGEQTDFAMAEFYILPVHRRKGYAADAACQLFTIHSGRWQIKYHIDNLPAGTLWKNLAKPYSSKLTPLNEIEVVLSFET